MPLLFAAPASSRRARKAFTLTEVAVVLGIAGVLLAAVWGAASSASRNRNLTLTTTQIGMIVQNMRSLFRPRGQISTIGDLTGAMARGNIFPIGMTTNGGEPILSVWATPVTLEGTSANSFTLSFGVTLQPTDCIDLITRMTGAGRDRGLIRIVTNTNDFDEAAIDALTPTAINACDRVAFTFDIKGSR